ncbi:hypothetical protein QBC40DRAFT_281794 [Triangularia verruculosa]|uniref:Cell division cycle protein 123 n=1 Tax=Triangularia verruculosa TaxID=2587418 RepID=A0AAN6XJ86_9PEZI|nr:hypothetical protein QBC40DRAFT_281794 [Triangularia verruculosa]
MKLTEINYREVERALKTPNQTEFNTSFHSAEEAPDLTRPSEAPVSFKRWLPVILSLRNTTSSAPPVQTITLSKSQARLLLKTAEGSIQTGTLNRMYAEDIAEEITPLLQSQLVFPPEGLFLRLAACSPKDGAHLTRGKIAMNTVQEIILRIVTSVRARNALHNSLEAGEETFDLFFLPFDERMSSDQEYRVFCPPGGRRITAVSQYQWHKGWRYGDRHIDLRKEKANTILSGIAAVHKCILEDLDEEDELDKLLLQQGFSFDVFFDAGTEACELVELNGFGVRSSCGSCLFQWVKDREQLYGGTNELEFRVAI